MVADHMVHSIVWCTGSAGSAKYKVLHMGCTALHTSFYTGYEHSDSGRSFDKVDTHQCKAPGIYVSR